MDLFGLHIVDLLVILSVALVLFGPERLAEIAATVGKAMREISAARRELTSELEQTLAAVQEPFAAATQPPREPPTAALPTAAPGQSDAASVAQAPSARRDPVPDLPSKPDPLADLAFGEDVFESPSARVPGTTNE